MAIQLPRDLRDVALAEIGRGLGAGIGGAFKQKGLTGAVERMTRQGVTPEGIFQRMSAFDPEFAQKNLEATFKVKAKEESKAFGQSLAMEAIESGSGFPPEMLQQVKSADDFSVIMQGVQTQKDEEARKTEEAQAQERIAISARNAAVAEGRAAQDVVEFTALEKYRDAGLEVDWAKLKAANEKAKTAPLGKTLKERKLSEIKADYFGLYNKANSALLGVDQFLPDPDRKVIAAGIMEQANALAQAFIDAGGSLDELGLDEIPEIPIDPIAALTDKLPPGENKGRVAVSSVTGDRYRSDGKSWIKVEK